MNNFNEIYDNLPIFTMKDNYWYIKTKFNIHNELIPALNDFYKRQQNIGVTFGEFDKTEDISLSRVSHTIQLVYENFETKFIKKTRKIKLDKLNEKNFNNVDYIKVNFEIKVLKTPYGKILSDLLNNNSKIKTVLYYRKDIYFKKIYSIYITNE